MLRVMTLNLNYYGDKHGDWATRRELICDRIEDARPDIIAFQAVKRDATLYEGLDQVAQLANLLPMYSFGGFWPAVEHDDGTADGSGFLSMVTIADVGAAPLTLIPRLEDSTHRIVLHARFDLPGGPLHVFNAHWSWVEQQAMHNAVETLPLINAVEGAALLVGDLSQTSQSEAVGTLVRAGWIDVWDALQWDHAGYTFEAPEPTQRIDYIWANAAAMPAVQNIEMVAGYPNMTGAGLSDHVGLMSTLALEV